MSSHLPENAPWKVHFLSLNGRLWSKLCPDKLSAFFTFYVSASIKKKHGQLAKNRPNLQKCCLSWITSKYFLFSGLFFDLSAFNRVSELLICKTRKKQRISSLPFAFRVSFQWNFPAVHKKSALCSFESFQMDISDAKWILTPALVFF